MLLKAFLCGNMFSLYSKSQELRHTAPATARLSAAEAGNLKMERLHSTKVALFFQLFYSMFFFLV